ncbi:MAG: AAA domain-containing protein, partial [Desulfofundulus sp.]
QDADVVQHLIDEHLQGIPNNQLYDGHMSVYDLAMQSFGGVIRLVEHFRSVPEIIQFSNKLSYNGEIKPLRDPGSVILQPHVVPYRVTGATSENKINRKEALAVASLIVAAVEQPEYRDKTFGVISLVGDEQAAEIDRLLRRYLNHQERERRRIICGNAAHFQGDERDVMFLSLVDGPAENPPLPLRGPGHQNMYKKRFNVAASRARDQMWVVYSLDPRVDLKEGDLRRELILYAEDPQAVIRRIESAETSTESVFEREVMRRLIAAGYRVVPQWKVGYYRIDLVVEGNGRRLAIECDGDRYHPLEKLPEDMARQALLERLGWTFVRIRGSQFFRDPEQAMKPVWRRLNDMGIMPGETEEQEKPLPVSTELKDRVVRRAMELQQEWLQEEKKSVQDLFRS